MESHVVENSRGDPPSLFASEDPPPNAEVIATAPEPGPSSRSSPPCTRPEDTRNPPKAFYVSVPHLPLKQKEGYSQFSEELIPSNDEFSGDALHSIIGEYKEGPKVYYFVKIAGDPNGYSYKVSSKWMKATYPNMVEQYNKQKTAGLLEPFDPQAPYVHPLSRVHLKITLSLKGVASRDGLSSLTETDDTSDYVSSGGGLESETYSDPPLGRRSHRLRARDRDSSSEALPYSPKRTRFRRKVHITDSDGTENEDSRKGNIPKKRRDRVTRGVASRPAYGHVRNIADLDYDSDPDTQALRTHRGACEKCQRRPAHELLASTRKPKKKNRRDSEESDDDAEEKLSGLGGWVQCLKCPVSAHWACLAKTQRDEILKAILERDLRIWKAKAAAVSSEGDKPKPSIPEPGRRDGLGPYWMTEFICGSCTKGGSCMMCKEVVLQPDCEVEPIVPTPRDSLAPPIVPVAHPQPQAGVEDVDASKLVDPTLPTLPAIQGESGFPPSKELLFRCLICKRLAHYSHLPIPPGAADTTEQDTVSLAQHYQISNDWRCLDCISFVHQVEHIIAWRPAPSNAVEPRPQEGQMVNHKLPLPREYLVKWVGRSYRRLQWAPHMWLVATHQAKLKNFLSGVTHVDLLPDPVAGDVLNLEAVVEPPGIFEAVGDDTATPLAAASQNDPSMFREPVPDAERKIQPAWKTVDRVLDVLLWYPQKRYQKRRAPKRGKARRQTQKDDESEAVNDEEAGAVNEEYQTIFTDGQEPRPDLTETIDGFERRTGEELGPADIDRVVWAFFKWTDLGYEQATWDSPPKKDEGGYVMFEKAFQRFLTARTVVVRTRKPPEFARFDQRPRNLFLKEKAFTHEEQPSLGQDAKLRLMPFQVDGVNWLCNNWWNLQHCILADEMGLGKTVQIVTFLGVVTRLEAFPVLVVVPNSTLTNWVREFERWAPQLRVCSFYGDAKARDIIKRYELSHDRKATRTTGAKYHVLVTTYETVTNPKEFVPVFRHTPRWEVLVVDEGQRLKSDSNLLFKRLKELNTAHRIILTGTPLNNNIRELFNLMNFLDPIEWCDLEKLEEEYAELTEERIKELHSKLRPYFLRRVKSEVLQLPPKNEVIVPVNMSPLQKEVYRSILSQNVALLKGLSQATKINAAVKNAKTNMNNILMQLRKCLQHPYLVSRDIEPAGLLPSDAHEKLIDASAKLRFLKVLLPKLKSRGHRVLLFSQFSIALTILEDFLVGEGIKYLRLDGSTNQADRQKGMDEFNRPGSDIFIYLLTTRAGGVGINLWSADTVIIFDPDFNPHQDLQAIARAHRFGQTKICLVFKLMVKDSAEERIMQTGKKKLVLDHLIVQKMDDEDSSEDVQSILMFGAQTLFQDNDNQSTRDIDYSEHDVDNLIEKTEKGEDQQQEQSKEGTLFSFAKVWAADRESLEEMDDDSADTQHADSWALTLQRLAAEMSKQKTEEATGRGVRRRAAAIFPQSASLEDTPRHGEPEKPKRSKKSKKVQKKHRGGEDSDAYRTPPEASDDETTSSHAPGEPDDLTLDLPRVNPNLPDLPAVPIPVVLRISPPPVPQAYEGDGGSLCGLCRTVHGEGSCFMTENSENLAEFRSILLSHAGDESMEERRAAIAIIDETLYKRGQLHLIAGQPLRLVGGAPAVKPRTMPQITARPAPNPRHVQQATTNPISQRTVVSEGSAPTRVKARFKEVLQPAPTRHHPDVTAHQVNGKSAVRDIPVPEKRARKKARAVESTGVVTNVGGPSSLGTKMPAPGPSSMKQRGLSHPIRSHNFNAPLDQAPSGPPLSAVPSFTLYPVPIRNPSAVAPSRSSSLKRPAPPTEEPRSHKKAKNVVDSRCNVCGGSQHPMEDCPVVLRGPHSIQKAIDTLGTDLANVSIVYRLEQLLERERLREKPGRVKSNSRGHSTSTRNPNVDVIDVSD